MGTNLPVTCSSISLHWASPLPLPSSQNHTYTASNYLHLPPSASSSPTRPTYLLQYLLLSCFSLCVPFLFFIFLLSLTHYHLSPLFRGLYSLSILLFCPFFIIFSFLLSSFISRLFYLPTLFLFPLFYPIILFLLLFFSFCLYCVSIPTS